MEHDVFEAAKIELDDDLAAIHREGDELGLVTRGEFNKLVHALQALRGHNSAPPPPNDD